PGLAASRRTRTGLRSCSARPPPQFAGSSASVSLRQRPRKLAGASAAFREALRLQADDAETHCGLRIAPGEQGQMPEAIAAFGRAIALQPNYAEAHYNLGVALREQGQLPEASAPLRRAAMGSALDRRRTTVSSRPRGIDSLDGLPLLLLILLAAARTDF